MWSRGGGGRSQVGANPIPIPHTPNLALFGKWHFIDSICFILLQGSSNRSRGLSPLPPQFNHWILGDQRDCCCCRCIHLALRCPHAVVDCCVTSVSFVWLKLGEFSLTGDFAFVIVNEIFVIVSSPSAKIMQKRYRNRSHRVCKMRRWIASVQKSPSN